MTLDHPQLVKSLRLAYSAEKAASFAYIGHAGSLRDADEIARVQEIEQDEWGHRRHVLEIMGQYDIPVSRWNELKYHVIGKVIGYSCYLIGRFMPYFFAGKLESGNVCEYFVMIRRFHSLGINDHDHKAGETLRNFSSINRSSVFLAMDELRTKWRRLSGLQDRRIPKRIHSSPPGSPLGRSRHQRPPSSA